MKTKQFASPASTSLDELVKLRAASQALQRRIKKKTAAPQSGGAVSRRLGRGLDFAEVREYQPGDDVRMIDWKVTARTGKTHTKLFVEERERPVLLVVDFRASMRFGTRGMYKSMLAARLAALLGWSAVAARDRVGGFVYTDDWHEEVRPQAGRTGLMSLFRAITHSQQRMPTANGTQLESTLRRLQHGVHSGSSVILLSDFNGFDDLAFTTLGNALQKLDAVAVHVCDPIDFALPSAGHYPLTANNDRERRRYVMAIGGKSEQHRYQEKFLARQQALQTLLAQQRHHYVMARTDQPLADAAMSIVSRQASSSQSLSSQSTRLPVHERAS